MMNKFTLFRLTLVLSLFFGAFANPQTAYAATLTVNNLNDSGAGSLRQAIADAASGDTINFSVTGTITLTSGQLAIDKDLNIVGPGSALLTIDGNNSSRIFFTQVPNVISISGMTMTHGYTDPLTSPCSGGGINNSAFLTLNDVIITDNDSTGIDPSNCVYPRGGGISSDNYGSLTITNSTISNNSTYWGGGGITFNSGYGTLSLTNVTVTGNQTTGAEGGGIQYVAGNAQATLNRVTISNNSASSGAAGGIDIRDDILITDGSINNNSATDAGGGISAGELVILKIVNSLIADNTAQIGGGVWMGQGANATLENTTVTGNTATSNGTSGGGGIYVWDNTTASTLQINNSTIALNKASGGGGIQVRPNVANDVNISNSIIADNTSPNGLVKNDCDGMINSQDYNLIESVSGCTITGATAHNITGQDANLQTLANNGGPTKTHALYAASPAIDAGKDSTCADTDQRGVFRPRGAHCDIGAFEYGLIVNKLADTNDGACDNDCSLREALAASADDDIVKFEEGLTGTITLDNLLGMLEINHSIIIKGPGANKISVSGNDQIRVFISAQYKIVQISGLTITHGYVVDEGGGAITNNGGDLTLDHVIVSNSQAVSANPIWGYGGGIFNYGTLTVTNSKITQNSSNRGGGIYNSTGSSLSVTDTVVEHNSSTSGGGLYLANPGAYADTVSLNRVSVAENTATVSGGGIFLGDSATISDSLIANNTASNWLASGAGGGIAISEAGGLDAPITVTLTNVTISGNTAYGQGGGVDVSLQQAADAVTFNNVTVANNHYIAIPGPPPGNGGGGIYASGAETMDIKNSIIAGNTSALVVGATSDCKGALNSLDHNLIQNTANCIISGTTTNNITGADAKLGALINNGGATQTMALLIDSPAIDKGNHAACPAADQRGIKRPQGGGCDMGAYETYPTFVAFSNAAQDGWTVESSENSNSGGAMSAAGKLRAGDDRLNRQVRSLISFNTAMLPDNALISSVTVSIYKSTTTAPDPFMTLGDLLADIKKGSFGLQSLQASDFSAAGAPIRTVGRFTAIPSQSGWYALSLNPLYFQYINLNGLTQFRIRFALDDNNNKIQNLIQFDSGSDTNKPQLIIEYTLP